MRRRSLLALVPLGLALATACSEAGPDRTPGPRTLDDYGTPVVTEVSVQSTGFSPTEVGLTAGEAIELVNEGGDDVRVVGDVVLAASDGGTEPERNYDTGTLPAGARTVLAFPQEARITFSLVPPAGSGDEALVVLVAPEPDGG